MSLRSGLKKLLLNHSQQVSLAVGFRFAWPPAVQGLLEGLDMISNVSDSVVATDCFVASNGVSAFRLRAVAVMFAPWLIRCLQ